MRLMRPALARVAQRPVVLLQAPHVPNALAFSYLGVPLDKLMLAACVENGGRLVVRGARAAGRELWCAAVLATTHPLRGFATLASGRSGDRETLLILVRPLASAQDASPATLRLGVRPAEGGIAVDMIKRRGPNRTEPLTVTLQPSLILPSPYRRVSRHSAPAFAGGVQSEVVA